MTDSIHELFFLMFFLFFHFFIFWYSSVFSLDELYTSVSVIYGVSCVLTSSTGGQRHSGGSCGRCVAVPCIDMDPTPDRRTFQHAVDSQLGRSRTDRGRLAVAVVIAVNCK